MPSDPQSEEWQDFETDQLAQNKCPYSGLRLGRRDGFDGPLDINGDDLACAVCDCFGFDVDDPRIGGRT